MSRIKTDLLNNITKYNLYVSGPLYVVQLSCTLLFTKCFSFQRKKNVSSITTRFQQQSRILYTTPVLSCPIHRQSPQVLFIITTYILQVTLRISKSLDLMSYSKALYNNIYSLKTLFFCECHHIVYYCKSPSFFKLKYDNI